MSDPAGLAPRPRLLVLASTYPRWAGDPEPAFVHELARRMVGDFEVTVLSPHAPGAATHEELNGVRVTRYRYAPEKLERLVHHGGILSNLRRRPWMWLLLPSFLLALVWSTRNLVRGWRPDLIHAHWIVPQGIAVAISLRLARAGIPLLITSHGADLFALRSSIFMSLKRFAVRRATHVTVVSPAMCAPVEQLGMSPAAISVEPMGVDLVQFAPEDSVRRDPNSLLFVGRLVEKKGLRHLIEAMPAIIAECPGVSLTVVGFGPERANLEELARAHGLVQQIQFVGALSQERLPERYRRAGVFVAPFIQSRDGDEEGLGLVSIEAAGCGCRLVLGDVPAVRSALAGLPGVTLVQASDVKALAEACVAAVRSGGAPAALRQSLLARYDWKECARRYNDLLRGLAKKVESPDGGPG